MRPSRAVSSMFVSAEERRDTSCYEITSQEGGPVNTPRTSPPDDRIPLRATTGPGAADVRRDGVAEALFARLHPIMGWLAALFVLVVVGDALVDGQAPFSTIFTVAGWVIWGIFVADFVIRMTLATSTRVFLKRNWWQLLFLLLPFLALFRFLMALRMARAGRLLSAVVRGTRSAAASLRSRLAAVAAVTVMVVLVAANVLFEFGDVVPYADALHAAALATITGEPIVGDNGLSKVMDVVLSLYSVVVFAAVAGSLGAFFMERRSEDLEPSHTE